MPKLYESPNLIELRLLASYLEKEGVSVSIINEHQAGNPGVPHWAIPVAAELWVCDASKFGEAATLMAQYERTQSQAEINEWRCRSCDEQNPGNFESCWSCGRLSTIVT